MRKLIIVGINTIRGFLTPLFNFCIAIIGIKLFGKENWGQVIDILLWVYFIVIVSSLGNKDYLIRQFSRNPSKINSHFFGSFFSRSPLLILSLLFFVFFQTNTALLCILLTVVMYCYSSLDSLIVYHQKFGLQLLSDLLSFIAVLSILFVLSDFSINTILLAFIAGAFIKTVLLVSKLNILKEKISFHFSILELKQYLPFFVITLLGWIATKIDLYIVTISLNKTDVSEYQIISNSFILINAGFAFIISPFSKHIYRLPLTKVNKIKTKLNIIALPYLLISSILIWLIMEKLLHLNIDINYYYLSSLKTLFPLFFIIDIMILNKYNFEKKVTYIIILGIIVNLLCIYFLIEQYQVIGVIISTCVSRFILLIAYKWQTKNIQ
jgi:O-antigen/teichoic acid export membrane protein